MSKHCQHWASMKGTEIDRDIGYVCWTKLCQKTPQNKDSFETFWKQQVNVGSWKIGRGNGKSHGKSWNSKSSKCTNPG